MAKREKPRLKHHAYRALYQYDEQRNAHLFGDPFDDLDTVFDPVREQRRDRKQLARFLNVTQLEVSQFDIVRYHQYMSKELHDRLWAGKLTIREAARGLKWQVAEAKRIKAEEEQAARDARPENVKLAERVKWLGHRLPTSYLTGKWNLTKYAAVYAELHQLAAIPGDHMNQLLPQLKELQALLRQHEPEVTKLLAKLSEGIEGKGHELRLLVRD